jgi:hypothetical protein
MDEEKLNHSGLYSEFGDTSMVESTTKLTKSNSFISQSGINAMKDGKEKLYSFKSAKTYTMKKDYYYNTLQFSVKNDFTYSSGVGNNTALPHVIIGDIRIPISQIANQLTDNTFDGCLEVKVRHSSLIGFLKVVLTLSNQNSQHCDEIFKKINNQDLFEQDQQTNPNFSQDLYLSKNNIWDKYFIPYTDLNPSLIEKYFIFDLDLEEKQRESVKLFTSTLYESLSNTSFNEIPKFLYKSFKDALLEENLLLLYELFSYLVNRVIHKLQDFNLLFKFLSLFSEGDKSQLYNLPAFSDYNVFFVRIYLIFIFHYEQFYKQTANSNEKTLSTDIVINKVTDVMRKVSERMKMTLVLEHEYMLELRDCLLWGLNILTETITINAEIKDNNEKKKEYSIIYDNCIQIISSRITIMKCIEGYMNDSQIISSMFRLLRKTIQVLTNNSSMMLDLSKVSVQPKAFSKEFRKLLINQSDGFFIITLRAILGKYFHYPELHNNLLIIIFQITSYLDNQNLFFLSGKLNLEEFKDNFDLYRGKLRVFSKMLNNLHLNILANLSDMSKLNPLEEYEEMMKVIMTDLKAFYRKTTANKKRYEDFKKRKQYEIEIQEIISRIGVNVTKYNKLSFSLIDSYFYDDIIEYLKNISRKGGKDFLQEIKEKKKKDIEEVKRYTLSIVENSTMILVNVMKSDEEEISDLVTAIVF